ncbi:MAG: peptidoglycan DD-metalloendopeptidase family protein [Pseudomonadota bacterium]
MRQRTPMARVAMLIAATALAAACTPKRSENAPIEIRSSSTSQAPAPSTTTAPQVQDLGDGIRDYGEYQAVIAQTGDTVSSLAARIGLSAAELGAYNGLGPGSALRGGDELVLPPRPGGYGTQVASAGDLGAPSSPGTQIEATPLAGGAPSATGTDPTAGGTWSPDLAAQAIQRATGIDENGELAAPPSATEPLPEEPLSPDPLQSPDLRQYQTGGAQQAASNEDGTVIARVVTEAPEPSPEVPQPQTRPAEQPATPNPELATPEPTPAPVPAATPAQTGARFERPVQGPIAIGYKQGAGGTRNDGVDFAAAPGTPVVAADDAEVALVSESLGGLGTIVLLRHADGLLTVYGRVTNVSLTKGALVSRGEQIGVVATPPSGSEARMHFEVRRGADSLDPTPFITG